MNILSEEQATARSLALPRASLLEDLSTEFVAEVQAAGAFVEYNQQAVIAAGEVVDYVSCIVAGRVKISRMNADYSKAEIARLDAGEWLGETNLFVRAPSTVEVYADGEAVIWTMPADTLRDLCFHQPQGTQLLYNFGARLAQKIAPQS
ncbi:MAG: Crp/Fnr family transcriptional regulator [Chthoniobacterales bacterium]